MTDDDVVEAMARAFAANSPCEMTQAEAISATRAAIRAVVARGGLVVAEMPDEYPAGSNYSDGHRAALVKVRAAAVKVEGV